VSDLSHVYRAIRSHYVAFTSQPGDSKALLLLSYSVLPLELSTVGRTIFECCRSVFAFALPRALDDTCACPIFHMSIEQFEVTTLPSRASRTIPEPCRSFLYSVFSLELSTAARTIFERCRSVFAFASLIAPLILARVLSLMSIERLDVSALAFTRRQDDFRALSLLSHSVFPLELSPAGRTIFECCRSVFTIAFPRALDDTCACPIFHVYRLIGCHCTRLHEPSERFQSLVAH
jgi:hypothetical protein